MFGESRWVTVLVIVGVLVAFVVFGYAIWSIVAERDADREASITSVSSSNVYIDPSQYPGWQAPNPDQVQFGGDMTPVAPDPGSSSTPSSGSGGIFGGLFGGGVPSDLPEGYSKGNLSASFRKVRIQNVNRVDPNGYNAANSASVVTIRENISGSEVVNLTGLRIKTNSETFLIPRAAKVYKTTGAPLTNVTLANGQSAYIIGSTSPLGANFLGNKCQGYLSNQYTFKPQLVGRCSAPPKIEIETFTGACQEYILSLHGTCKTGDPNNSRIPASDSACRAYVSGLNYDGCVTRRQGDSDFSNNSWNVFVGRSFVDPLHDLVLLLDEQGKLVDYYRY